MGLKLIYGRSGTGKSQHIFNEIKNIVNKEKIFIITPEQYSFSAEKRLLKTLDSDSVVNVEVLSFNRIAKRVLTQCGKKDANYLTKYGKSMLIYSVLKKNKKNLKFLTKPEVNIDVVKNSITEFKKHNVTLERLEKLELEDIYLKTKLEDLYLLYKSYEEYMTNRCIDENDILTILAKNIEDSEEFKDSIIYIDEFVGFTPQEYEILKGIFKIAKNVIITIPAEVNKNTNLSDISIQDIFYESKKTAGKIINCANAVGVEIISPIILNENNRAKNPELNHLERYLYSSVSAPYNSKTENINLFLAKNRYTEIEYLAQEIVKLVRDYGYRFKDIVVISNDISLYSSIAKVVFRKHNIPVFIDERRELNQNQIAKYIISIVDLVSSNWTNEAIFNYMKNSFSGIDINIANRIENYCTKWGIKNNKWINEWKYEDKDTEELEKIRKELAEKIECLKLLVKKGTFKNITTTIYDFLVKENIQDKIKAKVEYLNDINEIELAKEYIGGFNNIVSILDEIIELFNEEDTNIETYKDILKIGLDSIDIGEIPARIDQVIMGDVERSKTNEVRASFIIGLNDGIFPKVKSAEGFLNDNDRDMLKELGLELAAGTIGQIYNEQLNIYKAFTASSEKVFLSYSSADSSGKALRQSVLISKIKKIFPKITTKSDVVKPIEAITVPESTFDEMLLNLRRAQSGETINEDWYLAYKWYENDQEWSVRLKNAMNGLKYTNVAEEISVDNIKALYGNTLHTTISRLEQYRKCPFSFHMKYGLKLVEKSEFQLKPIDKGSFMHNVIERFFNEAENVKDMTELDIKSLVNKIIEEELELPKNYLFTSTSRFRILTTRLKRVIFQSINQIVEQLKYSDFKILGNEVEFKNGAKYKPIELFIDDGRKVEITGKIDRIDLATSGDEKYVRIIDYKSSFKDIDLNEVINGLQIQLITYLDSVREIENVLAAGALYFNLIDPIINSDKRLEDEEIKQQIKQEFKMKGLILADIKVIKMMDNRLQEGSSDIIPVTLTKDGEIAKKGGSTINKDDFNNLQKRIKRVIAELSKEILKGNIKIQPFKGKYAACDYCPYKSICSFNPSFKDNEYFKIETLKKEEILYNIKEVSSSE